MSHERKFPYPLLPHLWLIWSYESHNDSPAETAKVGAELTLQHQAHSQDCRKQHITPSQNRAEQNFFHRLRFKRRISRSFQGTGYISISVLSSQVHLPVSLLCTLLLFFSLPSRHVTRNRPYQ